MINELAGWFIEFITPQIPKDGKSLAYLFVFVALLEPAKACVFTKLPLSPSLMVGLGYALFILVAGGLQYLDDSSISANEPLLSGVFLLSLWLVMSGFIGALMWSPRLVRYTALPRDNKGRDTILIIAAFVALALSAAVYLLTRHLPGVSQWSEIVFFVVFTAIVTTIITFGTAFALGWVLIVVWGKVTQLARFLKNHRRCS